MTGTSLRGLLDLPYRLGAAVHRSVYSSGIARQRSLDGFAVSIGALHFGGAGKTPLVIDLAGPGDGVLMRGYGGRLRGQIRALMALDDAAAPWKRTASCNGEERPVQAWSEQVGDEAALVAAMRPGVPVGVGADRVAAAAVLKQTWPVSRFLLDDAFSHHCLRRDVDLLAIPVVRQDGELRIGDGPRREGDWAVDRADALVLVGQGARPISDCDDLIAALGYEGPFAAVRKEVDRIWSYPEGEAGFEVRDRPVAVVCALGRPSSLVTSLERGTGARVVATVTARDHHRFSAGELAEAEQLARRRGAEVLLTSLKDVVRFPLDFTPRGCWAVAGTSLVWDRGGDRLEGMVRER